MTGVGRIEAIRRNQRDEEHQRTLERQNRRIEEKLDRIIELLESLTRMQLGHYSTTRQKQAELEYD